MEHSFSSVYFAEKFGEEGISDAVYLNFPLENLWQLHEIFEETPLAGFNVTIPYKEAIIPYLDELSETAREIGAVNCVVRRAGRLTGHNTDEYGFRTSLLEMLGTRRPEALVLGSGGASKAVVFVLKGLGIDYRIVSTHPEKGGYMSYGELDEKAIARHELIINTTPLGTYPDMSKAPAIPYEYLTSHHILYDLVYNPPITKFLMYGQVKGARIRNGYRMLTLQADRSWKFFNN